MKIEILKEGSGAEATTGNTVTVNYTGTLVDGTKFDSSLNPGRTPFEFTLGQNRVIQGWELGVKGMKVGESRKLTIPPELGYGSQAVGGVIPANSTLIFTVDLLGIK
jgi:FKBP-type peptidyl-prolyl cis-trans isomerase